MLRINEYSEEQLSVLRERDRREYIFKILGIISAIIMALFL
ncbi:hypothetical protein Desor_1319 [Desulfosporosinus orientis DSM 765]|uniref:Uncharacterized protein n=1 Tax=Desulfosporosinus orientis (strain ATCC 19365 / DSM 765 / NCIMB 8382 / VKM B-1628 / Singapore I) TaxID=768706 RepID=G7W5P3_DESOD|nr:hypothetical protein [Desulfosporosinus orientis]AET66981.1 hypothetical protein Desor_1319 [Desulfosporosinus orientis DSM 765]